MGVLSTTLYNIWRIIAYILIISTIFIFCTVDKYVIWNTLMTIMKNTYVPITISLVVIYTACVEVVPRSVTRLNSNAYTSQTLWNVTLRSLQFQLVNYYLYHQYLPSKVVHGVTIITDCLLWTMYFHHLLHDNPWWAFCFIFFMCLLQALTFDDVKLKITLIVTEAIIIGVAGLIYHFYLEKKFASEPIFGYVSFLLLINALARVLSHMPEPLPIDYLGLHNPLPIKDWMENWTYLTYMLAPPRFLLSVLIGIVSELQAGLPVRLLTSALVLLLTRYNWVDPGLNMQQLKNRADQIDQKGWKVDQDGGELFAWEFDTEMQHMFKTAAKYRYQQRIQRGEKLPETWLNPADLLPAKKKVE